MAHAVGFPLSDESNNIYNDNYSVCYFIRNLPFWAIILSNAGLAGKDLELFMYRWLNTRNAYLLFTWIGFIRITAVLYHWFYFTFGYIWYYNIS